MSGKATQLIEKLFMRVTQIFSDVVSFHAHLRIRVKPFSILFLIFRWT